MTSFMIIRKCLFLWVGQIGEQPFFRLMHLQSAQLDKLTEHFVQLREGSSVVAVAFMHQVQA